MLLIGLLLEKSVWASAKLIYQLLSSEVWLFFFVQVLTEWCDVVLALSKLLQGQLIAKKYSVMDFHVFNSLTTYQQNFTWKINETVSWVVGIVEMRNTLHMSC